MSQSVGLLGDLFPFVPSSGARRGAPAKDQPGGIPKQNATLSRFERPDRAKRGGFVAHFGPLAAASVLLSVLLIAPARAPAAPTIVDTTPPETTIDSGPSGTTTDPTPTFMFSSSEPGSTFECRVDGGSFTPCTTPHTTARLADGPHTFQVRARDQAGNVDPVPAIRSFTVAPVTPPPPTFTSTDPPSGSDYNFIRIRGTAEPGSLVELYSNPSCSGSTEYYDWADLTDGSFAIFPLVFVRDNTSTTFYATARHPPGTPSSCSSSSITYVEVTPPLPCPPPEAASGHTYIGQNTGSAGLFAGPGEVCLVVSPDWSHVTSFWVSFRNMTGYFGRGPYCGTTSGGPGIPITSGATASERTFDSIFAFGVAGTFSGVQASGRTLFNHLCFRGVDWSAATSDTPPWAGSAPGPAPVPRPPILPLSKSGPPTFRLASSASQNPFRQRGVVVVVECPNEACTATAGGTVPVPGAAKVYRLRSTTKEIAKGGKAKLKPRLSKKALKAIKRAMRRGKKLRAKVTVTVEDPGPPYNSASKKLSIKLKR